MDQSNFINWLSIFFVNLNEFFSREYLIDKKKFTRKGKLTLEDVISYPLVQNGLTGAVSAHSFAKTFKRNIKNFNITRQAIGQKRKFINPIIYWKMAIKFTDKIYEDTTNLKKYKGYLLMACDGTELKLPNKKETKKGFNIKIHSLLKAVLARLKLSCIVDSNSKFIIDVLIAPKGASETKLAIKHIKRLKKRSYNLNEVIFIGDRGYDSLELILHLLDNESNFVIRLKSSMFKSEQSKMRSNDEFVNISTNNRRLRSTKDLKILKIMSKVPYINLRITKVKLPNGDEETLISNLSFDEFSSDDLKEIYRRRWKIETVYDFLKNTINVENFTGYNPIIIQQDLYSSFLFYNITNAINLYAVNKLQKLKKLKKDYSISLNVTAGIVKTELPELLLAKLKEDKNTILENIVKVISKSKIKINYSKRKDTESINSDKSNKFHMQRRIATL